MNKGHTGLVYGLLCCLPLLVCCKANETATDEPVAEVRTPVTITTVTYEPLQDYIELNATSVFLQRNFVKSNLNGYIQKANFKFGDYVHRGQILFVLKTKEAAAIGNAVNQLDSSFKFSGVNVIRADLSGYMAEINHQAGDYVQDGEQLAVINDARSFVFMLNAPYEYRSWLPTGKKVEVLLPDGEKLQGTIKPSLPVMDSATQTQAISVAVNSSREIPVNLIARVRVVKVSKPVAVTLDKKAVLSDESLSNFWVMKLINDSTAVKVPVKTGIESGDKVEIISPEFSPKDRIIVSGNYGLSDTASVIVSLAPSGAASK
jgi:multidrug efflux pump subunit AcrA (membrane-fusion protein)